MRMTKTTVLLSVLGAMFATLGCAGDIGDQGALLRGVDEGAMTSQVLYMVPELSAIPLTASELEAEGIDASTATPVRIEVFDEVAVAWFAPEGVPVIDRNSIVAIWSVVQRQTIAGELEPGTEISVNTPQETPSVAQIQPGATPSSTPYITNARVDLDLAPYAQVGQTIIDFFDRIGTPEDIEYFAIIAGYHPGC